MSKGKIAIKFELEGFQFDLVPAISNFSRDPQKEIIMRIYNEIFTPCAYPNYPIPNYSARQRIRLEDADGNEEYICVVNVVPGSGQYSEYKNYMPELKQALSPSSSKAGVKFVRKQPDYIKKLVRLTKFWQQSVAYMEFIGGRSFIFECIAIR